MNIINRPKTPFNAIKSLPVNDAKPMPLTEQAYAQALAKQAEIDRKAFKFGLDGRAQKREHKGHKRPETPYRDTVEAVLFEHGPATMRQIAKHLPDMTPAQISSSLSGLKDAGRAVVVADKNTRDGGSSLWGAA